MWVDPAPLGDVVVRVYDRGPAPAWHRSTCLHGPWLRYEARLADRPSLSELAETPSEAVARVVTMRPIAVDEALSAVRDGRSS